MDARAHWENVYTTKATDSLSWFRPHLETSLRLIQKAAPDRSAAIMDVGGGASTLVDDLLNLGYASLTVLDISATALEKAKQRLGPTASRVSWLAGDVTQVTLLMKFDVWHDRAVFHFLTQPSQRAAYIEQMLNSLKPGSHVIMGTFGPAGPTKCSGLDVMRYDAAGLASELGPRFQLLETCEDLHQTPSGATQQFLYCLLSLT